MTAAFFCLLAISGGCELAIPKYDVDVDKQRFYAAEGGRVITMVNAHVRKRGSPLSGPPNDVFVEWCDPQVAPTSDREMAGRYALACWPVDGRRPDDASLEQFLGFPPERTRYGMTKAVEYLLARSAIPVRPTQLWIIGTNPRALALTTRPARAKPAGDRIKVGSEAFDIARQGNPHDENRVWLVTDAEAAVGVAEYVLLLPPDVDISAVRNARGVSADGYLAARLFRLDAPRPLMGLVHDVADGRLLEAYAVESITVKLNIWQ